MIVEPQICGGFWIIKRIDFLVHDLILCLERFLDMISEDPSASLPSATGYVLTSIFFLNICISCMNIPQIIPTMIDGFQEYLSFNRSFLNLQPVHIYM